MVVINNITRFKLYIYWGLAFYFDEVFAFQSKNSPCICVLLDYNDKKIVDILPSRRKADLIQFFTAIPLEERNKVKYVCFDMWETYRSVSKLMFPNSKGVLDKFHVVAELRRCADAVNKTRITS